MSAKILARLLPLQPDMYGIPVDIASGYRDPGSGNSWCNGGKVVIPSTFGMELMVFQRGTFIFAPPPLDFSGSAVQESARNQHSGADFELYGS